MEVFIGLRNCPYMQMHVGTLNSIDGTLRMYISDNNNKKRLAEFPDPVDRAHWNSFEAKLFRDVKQGQEWCEPGSSTYLDPVVPSDPAGDKDMFSENVRYMAFRSFFNGEPGHIVPVESFRDGEYLLDLLGTELSYVANAFPTQESAQRFLDMAMPDDYYIYASPGVLKQQ